MCVFESWVEMSEEDLRLKQQHTTWDLHLFSLSLSLSYNNTCDNIDSKLKNSAAAAKAATQQTKLPHQHQTS